MKKLFALLLSLCAAVAVAQQPQTQTNPLFAVNAQYTNGVAPGYYPLAGSGLTLDLGAGTVWCAGTIVTYSGGTLTMTASTTNYVYLNTASSCVPAVKTAAFVSTDVPIAKVVTSGSAIMSISDVRPLVSYSPGTLANINGGSTLSALPINGITPLACADSSGSGTAQSCSTTPTFTPVAPNCVDYSTTTANSGAGLTVNINSLGAIAIAIPGSSGWTTTLTTGIIPANKPIPLCYDGTNWDAMQTGTASWAGIGATPETPYYASANTLAGNPNLLDYAHYTPPGQTSYAATSVTEDSSYNVTLTATNSLPSGGGTPIYVTMTPGLTSSCNALTVANLPVITTSATSSTIVFSDPEENGACTATPVAGTAQVNTGTITNVSEDANNNVTLTYSGFSSYTSLNTSVQISLQGLPASFAYLNTYFQNNANFDSYPLPFITSATSTTITFIDPIQHGVQASAAATGNFLASWQQGLYYEQSSYAARVHGPISLYSLNSPAGVNIIADNETGDFSNGVNIGSVQPGATGDPQLNIFTTDNTSAPNYESFLTMSHSTDTSEETVQIGANDNVNSRWAKLEINSGSTPAYAGFEFLMSAGGSFNLMGGYQASTTSFSNQIGINLNNITNGHYSQVDQFPDTNTAGTFGLIEGTYTTGQCLKAAPDGQGLIAYTCKIQLAAAYTNSSTTPSTIWSFPVAASTNYHVSCEGRYKVVSGGTFEFSVTGPASPINVGYTFRPTISVSSNVPSDVSYAVGAATSYPTSVNTSATGASGTDYPFHIDLDFNNGTTAGTLAIQGNTISTDTLTVEIGATCIVQ